MTPARPCLPDWPQIDTLDPRTAVEVQPADGCYSTIKAIGDLVLAAVLLVPALPVILSCWAAVRLTSPGPGLYTQTRLGRRGREYRIIKIHTMAPDAEQSGAQWAEPDDLRVTRVGRFLRATHLDELPQLFNVLLGQMSLVGPRPERPEMVKSKGLSDVVPGYTHRLLVKPGMTGLAQLQLPADSDLTSVRHKVVYDLFYVENASPWLDFRILSATGLKAIGVRKLWLRRSFFLPGRTAVATVFLRNLLPPDASSTFPRMQPA
jgi:lipopolysaccharide/colanic/teichoic acid biosynthesis glycosyltransferase